MKSPKLYLKSSASPCPLDQVSIIVLKKCPYLRTYLWKIIRGGSRAAGTFKIEHFVIIVITIDI